jgi:quercetin dioxygenase-like cupin family protein
MQPAMPMCANKRSTVNSFRIVVWANLARTTKHGFCRVGLLAFLGLASPSFTPAFAADDYMRGLSSDRISVQSLLPLMPSKTIIGQDYAYPKSTPLLESYLIEIPPGQKTAIHLHQVPLLAYVLSGKIETNYGSKGTKVSGAGDLFVEAIEWCHFGQTVGSQPVRILAIYLNSVGSDQKKSVDCSAMQ